MASEHEERNRVFGMPRGADPHAKQDEEQQHVLGVPVSWFGPVDRQLLRSLTHPIRGYKRWVHHRRMGPYAPDENQPSN
jgi:hypothetical protein